MAEIIKDENSVYFRCSIGAETYGFSIINIAEHDREWIVDNIERSLINAYHAGFNKGKKHIITEIKRTLEL